jgi:hypothetical protein
MVVVELTVFYCICENLDEFSSGERYEFQIVSIVHARQARRVFEMNNIQYYWEVTRVARTYSYLYSILIIRIIIVVFIR